MSFGISRQLLSESKASARLGWIGLVAICITACGGGGGDGDSRVTGGQPGNPPGNQTPSSGWTPGVYQPYSSFAAQCASPRTGVSPVTGRAYPDTQGSVLTENNWLRSWTNHLYLWYSEVPDIDPATYSSPLAYFDVLKTSAVTPSGQPKDRFHFTYPTEVWEQLSQSGVEAGYGIEWVAFSTTPPRRFVVAFTEPNSPAANAGVARGMELLAVDGADFRDANTQTAVNVINAGLFPDNTGETHELTLREPLPPFTVHVVSLTSTQITRNPVPTVKTIPTSAGLVGYLLFNDHIATSEQKLIDAITTLRNANVQELVLDIRYNGGGYLAIANELAYMIAGNVAVGRVFERVTFNDKHPTTNPVTGEALTPIMFATTRQLALPATALPPLNLSRVYVITGPGTCSASESIINSLRGINFPVYQIGSTTCGKPYGFYAFDNCGTTYFSIQFKGANDAGFGDYSDGFSPSNTAGPAGTSVNGCSVADDFTRELGDESEHRLAAALSYLEGGTCPAPSGSAPGAQLKANQSLDAADGAMIRGPWRENRILTQ
jgi:carboxyl-terminal processing protease